MTVAGGRFGGEIGRLARDGEWSLQEIGGARKVPGPAWDVLARRGFHLHSWFAAAEGDPRLQPRHVGISRAGALLCVVPAYLESSRLHGDLHDRWLGPARSFLDRLGVRLRPTLAVGAPFATSSEPLGEIEALPASVWSDLFRRLEQRAARERAVAIVCPFLGSHGRAMLEAGRRSGYAVAFAGSTAVLHCRWASFEEYVASRSKTVRRTIRSELEELEREGVHTEATQLPGVAGELAELYRESYARRNGHPPDLDSAFFQRLGATVTPTVWAQVTRRATRIVAASVNAAAGGSLDGAFAAYAAGELGGPVYAADAFYQPLRAACSRGLEHLDLGPGALYAKVLRGAELRARWTLVRGVTLQGNAALRGLAVAVDRRNRWKERRALGPLWRRSPPPGATP